MAKILIIDDRPASREFLVGLLGRKGHTLMEAVDAVEGFNIARAERPDLVITDILSPTTDGYEFVQRLRSEPGLAGIRILCYTAHGHENKSKRLAETASVSAFVTKPCDPHELLLAVEKALGGAPAAVPSPGDEPDRERLGLLAETPSPKAAEPQPLVSERLFRALIDRSTDGIEVIDPDTGRFLDVNERTCVEHGYTRDEFLRMSVADIDPMVASRTWATLLAEGLLTRPRTLESEHRRKDGSTFPVEASFTTITLERPYLISVVRDITERRRTDELLRLRDRAIRAVTQGIIITDASRPDNPIVYTSPGFERITGYTTADVVGKNCRFLQGPDTNPEALSRLRLAIHAGEACTVELLNRRKDGTPFWNELSCSPILNDSRQVTHFVGVITDVTAKKSMEDQFRQSQKMEAVGRLAGGVAHDFNNLLTVIIGYSELLLTSLSPEEPARGPVAEILDAGKRSAALTRQLLAFSRRQVLAPRLLHLNTMVIEAEKLLHRLLGEDVRLTAVLGPDLWPVRADPGLIDQVLMNLAVNARDAMPTGGQLTIETRNVELDETDTRSRPDAGTGPHVLLSMSDTGSGMTPEVMGRIFEPFFTTKGPHKGTGLGLATVYGIVKQSGGHVAVDSELGRGTTFKVYLPRTEDASSAASPDSPGPGTRGGSATVLLVEDDDAVRGLGQLVLDGCGYRVTSASTADEAIRFAERVKQLDVLITDVVMPDTGGGELAARIVARHPAAKVLYLSGYTDDAVTRHGVRQEAVHFLQKPYTPASLAAKVREVLDSPALPSDWPT